MKHIVTIVAALAAAAANAHLTARVTALVIASAIALFIAQPARALTINPTSDGSLYTCSGCTVVQDGAYVTASGDIQGAIKFSSAAIGGTVTQALLSLNPYALPLHGPQVSIYGYGTGIGQLDVSDANAGTLLGVLTLPPDLKFGQNVFFDVTSFVANTSAPYLAFSLRATSTDVFSSLEYNNGHASQLLVTAVPEPATGAMLAAGLFGVMAAVRRRRHLPPASGAAAAH